MMCVMYSCYQGMQGSRKAPYLTAPSEHVCKVLKWLFPQTAWKHIGGCKTDAVSKTSLREAPAIVWFLLINTNFSHRCFRVSTCFSRLACMASGRDCRFCRQRAFLPFLWGVRLRHARFCKRGTAKPLNKVESLNRISFWWSPCCLFQHLD